MKCPTCSSEMDQGKTYIRGRFFNSMYFSLFPQQCWFESNATGKRKLIVRNSSGLHTRADEGIVIPSAYHCEDCGTSVIIGATYRAAAEKEEIINSSPR